VSSFDVERNMNPNDLKNLEYIKSLNEEEFDEWMETLAADDVAYAIELLQAARANLIMMEVELADEVEELTEAQEVLAAIMARS
jgi:hypothetical protein